MSRINRDLIGRFATCCMFGLLMLSPAPPLTQSARILAYLPLDLRSHHAVYQPLIFELGRRGHHVVYVSPIAPLAGVANSNVTHVLVENLEDGTQEELSSFFKAAPHKQTQYLGEEGLAFLRNVCKSQVIQQLIHSDLQFDLILHEAAFIQDHAAILQHRFNAPGVLLASLGDCAWVNELAGLTNNPSYMIDHKVLSTDRMNFFERLYSTYTTFTAVTLSYLYQRQTQLIVDTCFKYDGWETRPPLSQLMSDQSLILVNSHVSVGYPFPQAPHYKEIGGINVNQDRKPLPKDLRDFLDSAKHGAIYFSLGTYLDEVVANPKFSKEVASAFGAIKQKVVWKCSGTLQFEVPKNVKIVKWAPQQDILAHNNVKLFITHGGLLSLFEAANNAVPLVVIPFFGDQPKNAKLVASLDWGAELDLENVTSESLFWAIREVLGNEKYKKSAVTRSALFKDRPMTPLDEGVHWIEYVLKHGRVLQPASAHLSFVQMHLLDVYAFIIICICIIYYAAMKTIRALVNALKSRRAALNKKKA